MAQRYIQLNEYNLAALLKAAENPDFDYGKKSDKAAIRKINMIPKDANVCKIYTNGKDVFAGTKFYAGDIVEICPARPVTKSALYDRDVRQMVFEVDPNNTYVIPLGYCQYYRLSDEMNPPNVDYVWDPNMSTIVIKALTDIPKGDILILEA